MDLNDLRYFALIVQEGGFSAAERKAHITKSKLSRRVAELEGRLGVRLLQRSTRRLALTEAGRAFYEHCAAMLVEAEAARESVEQLRSEPSGTVRITCPVSMSRAYVARLLGEFLVKYPKVRIELDATDRVVNLIDDRVDLAMRATFGGPLEDPNTVVRKVATGRGILVVAPGHPAAGMGEAHPEELAKLGTVGPLLLGPEQIWTLISDGGPEIRVTHRPRILCPDYSIQMEAAIGGAGVAGIPIRIAWESLHAGLLVHVGRAWSTPPADIYIAYLTKRGMLPSVRALVDFLAERMPMALGG